MLIIGNLYIAEKRCYIIKTRFCCCWERNEFYAL